MEGMASAADRKAKAPKIWIGYLIAAIFLIGEATVPNDLLFVIGFSGVAYWYFCIYQIHVVLAEVTGSSYPISARKAVGYHFIPFVNFYWLFEWPRQVAQFVNSRSPRIKMPSRRAAFFLLCGFAMLKFDGAIGLCILFATTDRIVHRIDSVLPGFIPVHPGHAASPQRWQRLRVAIAAGLGTSVGFIIFDALQDFGKTALQDKIQFLVVSLLMLFSLRPLSNPSRIKSKSPSAARLKVLSRRNQALGIPPPWS